MVLLVSKKAFAASQSRPAEKDITGGYYHSRESAPTIRTSSEGDPHISFPLFAKAQRKWFYDSRTPNPCFASELHGFRILEKNLKLARRDSTPSSNLNTKPDNGDKAPEGKNIPKSVEEIGRAHV